MAFIGVTPLDPTTSIGAVRLNVGDTEAVPLDPDVPGQGSYRYFSDDQIQAFLDVSGSSVARATGTAIRQMAQVAAMTERQVSTDDLGLNSKGRGASILAVAQSWFDQADAEDAAAVADIFEVVQYPGRADAVTAGWPL